MRAINSAVSVLYAIGGTAQNQAIVAQLGWQHDHHPNKRKLAARRAKNKVARASKAKNRK